MLVDPSAAASYASRAEAVLSTSADAVAADVAVVRGEAAGVANAAEGRLQHLLSSLDMSLEGAAAWGGRATGLRESSCCATCEDFMPCPALHLFTCHAHRSLVADIPSSPILPAPCCRAGAEAGRRGRRL